MSGQLFGLNEGADCNLVMSPVYRKEGCIVMPLLALGVPVSLSPGPAGRNKPQGTATSWPLAGVIGVVALLEEGLKEITAKSTRPEAGLMTASAMVPTVWPEEL
jgi:hypothetical protein